MTILKSTFYSEVDYYGIKSEGVIHQQSLPEVANFLKGELTRLHEVNTDAEEVAWRADALWAAREENMAARAKLKATKSKLDELVRTTDELDVWDREHESREELLARVEKLELELAKAAAALAARFAIIKAANVVLADLRSELEGAQQELRDAEEKMQGMQSTRSIKK